MEANNIIERTEKKKIFVILINIQSETSNNSIENRKKKLFSFFSQNVKLSQSHKKDSQTQNEKNELSSLAYVYRVSIDKVWKENGMNEREKKNEEMTRWNGLYYSV